jgi:uncharacterized protein
MQSKDPDNWAMALKSLPLFPLPEVVFFPRTILPLHVFEDRYRSLVADAMEGHQMIGIPLLKPGFEADYEDCPEIYPVCGFGRITQASRLEDGRYNILVMGLGKVRIHNEWRGEKNYRLAEAILIEDSPLEPKETLVPRMRRLIDQLLPILPSYEKLSEDFRKAVGLIKDPEFFCHFLITNLVELAVDRQLMLETLSLLKRYEALEKWIAEASLRDFKADPQ